MRNISFVGVEALRVVTIKNIAFWDVTLCRPVDVHGRFGRTYCLHLRIEEQAKEHPEAKTKTSACYLILSVACLVYSSILKMETVRFFRNSRELVSDYTASHLRRYCSSNLSIMNCQLDGIYEGRGLSLRSGIIALFDKLE
jgi:hypothetical protein